jgi:hypothetical protein
VDRAVLGRDPKVVVIEAVGWLAVTGSKVVDLSRLPVWCGRHSNVFSIFAERRASSPKEAGRAHLYTRRR